MILNKKEVKELEELAKPLLKWLNERGQPHLKVEIDSNTVKFFEQSVGIINTDFIKD